MPNTKCSKFKTTQKHHDNLRRDDFDESGEFRDESYEHTWICKECNLEVTEYYRYSGYIIRDKHQELENCWN